MAEVTEKKTRPRKEKINSVNYQERNEFRASQCIALGLIYNGSDFVGKGSNPHGINVNNLDIQTLDDTKWADLTAKLTTLIANDVPFVESENVSPEATGVVVHLSVEEVTTKEVARLDINKVKIAQLKKQYSKLAIIDVNDKAGYKKVKEAKAVLRGMRTGVERKRKEIKADYIQIGKGIDAAASEYTVLIEEIEKNIDASLDQYEAWEKAEDERKEREAQQLINDRVDALKDAGMVFNGAYYAIGPNISMGIDVIKTMVADDFAALLDKVRQEKTRIDEEHEKQQRINSRNVQCSNLGMFIDAGNFKYPFTGEKMITVVIPEIAELSNEDWDNKISSIVTFISDYQKAELEAKNELKRQQDEQNEKERKLAADIEALRVEKLQMREQMAHNAGLTFNPVAMAYEFTNKYTSQSITKERIELLTPAEFAEFIKEAGFAINAAKDNADAELKKEQQRQNTISERVGLLQQLGLNKPGILWMYKESGISAATDFGDMPDNGWQTHLNELINRVNAWEKEKREKADRDFLIKARNAACVNVGMLAQANGYIYPLNEPNHISINNTTIGDADDVLWDKEINAVIEFIENHKRLKKEAEQKAQLLFDERCNLLITLGMGKEGAFYFYRDAHVEKAYTVDARVIAVSSDEEWESIYKLASEGVGLVKQSGDNRRKEIETERQKALPEIQRAIDYLNSLRAILPPVVETEGLKNMLFDFDYDFKKLTELTLGYIATLS